jgi:hypothetical protein
VCRAAAFYVQTARPVTRFAANIFRVLSLPAIAHASLFEIARDFIVARVTTSEPTNSAPGILGGARIVWFVVLQESRITASAAVPPTPHSSFSRLPWIHRVSLECHTDGEYCQKHKTVTTHFFGFFLSAD